MSIVYNYILAPNTAHNYGVLLQAIAEFPGILANRQLKVAYQKSAGDVADNMGGLVVPALPMQYIYLKANASEIDYALLSQVQDAQVFNIDTQPFDTFWI